MHTWNLYYWHDGHLYNNKGTDLGAMTVETARQLIDEADADLVGGHTGCRAKLLERAPQRVTFLGIGRKES
jgi:hypothetical protein